MMETPATITNCSIVPRMTVRIALMATVINDLGARLGEILNVYIQAVVTEKT